RDPRIGQLLCAADNGGFAATPSAQVGVNKRGRSVVPCRQVDRFHHPPGENSPQRTQLRSKILQLRARQEIRCTFCCSPAGPLARRERRAYPLRPLRYVRSEQHSQRACPAARERGASRAKLGILDDATTSPASRRLASARPALAPKCTPYC